MFDADSLPDGWAQVEIATDRGADGSTDLLQVQTYDARGDRILMEVDQDGDGWFDQVTAYITEYDGNRRVRVETDQGADGWPDALDSFVYDRAGKLIRREHDDDLDGVLDRVEWSTYGSDGRLAQWDVDSDGDGAVDMRQAYGRTPEGETWRVLDRLGNGGRTTYFDSVASDVRITNVTDERQNTRIERFFDSGGTLLSMRTDRGADSTIDAVTHYTYDADGEIAIIESDTNGNGETDVVSTRTWSGERLRGRCR